MLGKYIQVLLTILSLTQLAPQHAAQIPLPELPSCTQPHTQPSAMHNPFTLSNTLSLLYRRESSTLAGIGVGVRLNVT